LAADKVALGVVDGLNNKIRVIQRRCYGLRDEDHLHLKILTCTLPPLPRTCILSKFTHTNHRRAAWL